MEEIYFCIDRYDAPAKYLLLQPMNEHEIQVAEDLVDLIGTLTNQPFLFAGIKIKDWNKELPPWNGHAVFGKEDFYGGADETLHRLTEKVLPDIKQKYQLADDCRIILGGYSLAGLFALYSGYESDVFDAIAAASPSVWFPKFTEYAGTHAMNASAVYLSLGDREEKTKNRIMSTVGDCIRQLDNIFAKEERPDHSILEWNEGNHFSDFEKRMARGYEWCMKELENDQSRIFNINSKES